VIRALAVTLVALAATLRAYAADSVSLRDEVLTTWTTGQGLPQNFVTALAQTSDGFLWVGTMNGLVRFDGMHFRGFSHEGPRELNGFIAALMKDGSDGLWIVTTSGILHYADRRFTAVALEGRQHFRPDEVARAQDGGLWVFNEGKLMRTHGNGLVAEPMPTGAARVRAITETRDGSLWLADGAGVHRMRGGKQIADYALSDCRLLYSDRAGVVWAGDGHRLFRFDGNGFALVANPGETNFVSMMIDSHNRLWMSSGGLHGLSRNDGGHIEVLTESEGLASNDVRTILEDRSGDIWIGTIAGLQRLHHGIFTAYSARTHSPGSQSETVSIFEQKDGSIWTGTLEDGVVRWSDGRAERFGKAQGLSPGQVRGFFEHGPAPAIAIADYGIFERSGTRFVKKPAIPKGYVTTPVIAGDGSLWFRVENRGLFRLADGLLREFGTADGLDGKPLSSLGIDAGGRIWVGDAVGVRRWDGLHFQPVIASYSGVLCAAWLRSGLAAGTFQGLLLRSGPSGEGRMLTQNEGLPGSMVLDVLGDEDDNLWLVTASAIARIPRADWIAFAEGRVARIHPQVFTEADGLKSRYVLPLNEVTAMRAHDGRLWFATVDGPAVIDPHLPSAPPTKAVLDGIAVDDEHLLGDDLTIRPGRHRITFTYTAPATTAPEQTRFRYRLVGWDRDWVDAGAAREVSYTGLPPGHYRFQVLATGRDGGSSRTPAEALLVLRPFFWQTRWFLVLVVCMGVVVVAELTRRLTRRRAERLSLRFQERVAERERIAHQIHDTVIQDLIGATLQLELIGFEIADSPHDSQASLSSLARRMRDTIARSRNMVSNLHSTAIAEYSLVELLRHAEAEFRISPSPLFHLSAEGEPREVHPLIRDEVYRICREALANAFRHSGAEYVTVEVRFLPELLEVEISDDGKGMPPELLEHGRMGHFGLRGMRAHAQRIDATLAIESEPGQGTNVILRVKTQRSFWQNYRKGKLGSRERISSG
jgi:signal transduction histidine kinase/streptogramin lyase